MNKGIKRIMASAAAITMVTASITCEAMNSSAYTKKGDEVVTFAENQEGVIVGRPNVVTDFYNGVVTEWCAMFVQYCASKLGVGDKVPYSSFCDDQPDCPGGVSFFKNRGEYVSAEDKTYRPDRSDVIYLDWNGDGRADHVGFVKYTVGDTVYTIEGNRGDAVTSFAYNLYSENILGYGRPDYEGNGGNSGIVDVSGLFDSNGGAMCKVTSPVGAWLRSTGSYGDNKIGIVSTGTQLYSDGYFGEWLHFTDVPVEGAAGSFNGWINASTLTSVSVAQTPSYEPETPQYTPEYTPEYVPEYTPEPTYSQNTAYISSCVGAWLRSSAAFTEYNKIGVLDTSQAVDVYDVVGEWLSVGAYLNGVYTYGYVHYSTVSGDANAPTTPVTTNWYVSSSIGCNFRSDPEFNDSNIIGILDYCQSVEVISISGEWAFAKAELYGYTMYGYVHTSTISC